jgi:type II secretory pathway pseudopilin PulG
MRPICTRLPARPREPRGVVLLALLLTLALGGIAAMAALDVWSLARQRMQEEELLFVGDQYRRAIQRYYFGAPQGTGRVLPESLEDLLEDDRYPVPVHHLRRLYPDPISGGTEWGVLRIGGRVAGVYSLSQQVPVKQAGFAQGYEQFGDKEAYRDWVFAVSASGEPLTVIPPGSADPNSSGIEAPSPKRASLRKSS